MAILSCHVSIKLPPKISDGQRILEGEGETRSSIEPAGRPFPTRRFIILEIRCQFIILARKDEPTQYYAREN